MTADPLPITPLSAPVGATVALPGSKSITNRALVCAALAAGESTLVGVLRSDDTDAMIDGLGALGVSISVVPDSGGTTLVIRGTGGAIGRSSASVDARLSGTTSRFLLPVAALGNAPITIDGGPSLRARPMSDLVDALIALGVQVESVDGALPITVMGSDRLLSDVSVGGSVSSQFLSALLLTAPYLPDGLTVSVVGGLQSRPYVDMTIEVMRRFGAEVDVVGDHEEFEVVPVGYGGCGYEVEPDASAASYFFAAAALVGGSVTVEGLGTACLQGDVRFVDVLEQMGATVERTADRTTVTGTGRLAGGTFDFSDISDTAQTLAAIAPFADSPVVIEGIGFIRRKETDRIAAMVTELQRCGVAARELEDGIEVLPGAPGAAVIETYHDHRMAMSFAVLGLRSPGISIADPGCVAKTFPGFWTALGELRG